MRRDSRGVCSTRFKTSRTILVSYSRATTFLALCNNGTVRLPVPGPISNTTSVDWMADFCTIDATTAGFLRKCCPNDVLGVIKFTPEPYVFVVEDEEDDNDDDGVAYGCVAPLGLDRLRLDLGMVVFWCV